MPRTRVAKLSFNRGLVSRLGLARADIKRVAMAAEIYKNWMPRTLGSMMLRPGKGFLGATRNDSQPFNIPFIFSASDKATCEITDEAMRVWIDDAVVERTARTALIGNGGFDANLAGWTDADESGATSDWVSGGYMGLTGTGSAFAIRRQEVAIAAADFNGEHGLHILVHRGPVLLRVGSASGLDDLIGEVELNTGAYSFGFTPTGVSAWVEFKSALERTVMVDNVAIEAAGDMVVEAPWLEEDLRKIRYDQSGDILFIACDGNYQQRRIERHATRSWGIARYQANDGPMRTGNATGITITPSGLDGNITISASAPIFSSEHGPSATNDGALFRLTSNGQTVDAVITAQNQFTEAIRVTGVDNGRVFTVSIDEDGAGSATFTLQRSLESAEGPWNDVLTRTADTVETYDDTLDNQIAWYRLGVKTGDYGSGTHTVSLNYTSGGIDGIVRITGFTSTVLVDAEVLEPLGGLGATDDWAEGEWSDFRGWPTAVALHEGRLNWDGRDRIQLSESDGFAAFGEFTEGDSRAINRSIGAGPVDKIQWAISLQRLLIGGEGAEYSARSSSLDEPLTADNFNLKVAATQGSAPVQAVKADQSGFFVQRGGIRAFELSFGAQGIDYEAQHLSALVPEIGLPGIVKIAVQNQPDRRLHYLRSNGTVALLLFDKVEQVLCWIEIETADNGVIEDIDVLPANPGDEEDFVYYSTRRSIDGASKCYREKWAFEAECRGGTLNKQADSFIVYDQAPSATLTGLSHLIGREVVIWDNGKCLRDSDGEIATFTVDSTGVVNSITNAGAPYQVSEGVAGLQYTGSWQSAKLVELMEVLGGSLTDSQLILGMGLILADTHCKGLKYGPTLTEADMNVLPELGPEGAPLDPDTVHTDYTTEKITFPGGWSNDARLCLLAKAPRPATVLAALAEVEHHG